MPKSDANSLRQVEFETVSVDARGAVVARTRHSATVFREPLAQAVALEMVAVPAGSFDMGTPGAQGYEDERPVHRVSVGAFYLARFELTQEQWQAVMGKPHPTRGHGPQRPVDRVSCVQASALCAQLSRRTGHAYRVPTEAEWEYACRAGTTTPFHFGETLTTDLANYVGEHGFRDEPKGIYRHVTTDVGSFPPNAFGLYDMHGNVWEWCADSWHNDYEGAPADGSAWRGGDEHQNVVRGGCWHDAPEVCRSACRLKFPRYDGEDFVGFRVAADVGADGGPAAYVPEAAPGRLQCLLRTFRRSR
jgi:formylglycine-generating enzyme required for sulfatase activity